MGGQFTLVIENMVGMQNYFSLVEVTEKYLSVLGNINC